MIDILNLVYNILINDKELMTLVDKESFHFNDTPDAQEITKPVIVLDDYDDPTPEEYYDGDLIAKNYAFQVDVYVKANDEYNARLRRNEISNRIQKLLWKEYKIGFTSNLGNETNKQFALYRSTRRYEAIFYEEEF
ncbi:hypothetical protein [Mammaliicoccus lentus]|uniref:hypothetical protein n=1 Tax=Mammaliicoccus lentus TaxID=42858 RepID=UPI001C4E9386|nr:hypothetical protein [Mammaliicoccus lentus]MBW0761337.1 hypothetical protein [Mammaliicoccus lentus]